MPLKGIPFSSSRAALRSWATGTSSSSQTPTFPRTASRGTVINVINSSAYKRTAKYVVSCKANHIAISSNNLMPSLLIRNASLWSWTSGVDTGKIEGTILDNRNVAIKDGIIASITGNEELNERDFDAVIDAKHQLVLPGLIDSHIHVGMLGESQHYVNLEACFSLDELLSRVREAAEKEPDLPCLVGFNWDQSKLGAMPDRFMLDTLCIDKPIFLWRSCWHIGVANTAALRLARFLPSEDDSSPAVITSVQGGAIDMDADQITGILRERAVEPMIQALSAHKTEEQRRRFICEGLSICLQTGLTCVQTNDEECWSVYEQLEREKALPLRVMLTPVHAELQKIKAHRQLPLQDKSTVSSRLSMERVKLFCDGSLGAETAALLTDREQQEFKTRAQESDELPSRDHKGMLIIENNELVEKIVQAAQEDFRVEIHTIGDAAAAQALDAIERAAELLKPTGRSIERPILTHCQVLHPILIEKMARLGVIANVQPSFVPTDMRWVNERLSPAQISSSYCWKKLLYSHVHVAGGSDAPIESPSPFLGIYDAMERTNKHKIGVSEADVSVFRPEEKLSFSEALWLYTIEGAFAGNADGKLGSIHEGHAADLVIIPRSSIDNPEILRTLSPEVVIVGGEIELFRGEHTTLEKGTPKSTSPMSLLRPQMTEEDAPFLPGKGGKPLQPCQVLGFCTCFLKQQEYCW